MDRTMDRAEWAAEIGRGQGGRDNLAADDLEFRAVFTTADLAGR